jgi:hypothetical protein
MQVGFEDGAEIVVDPQPRGLEPRERLIHLLRVRAPRGILRAGGDDAGAAVD